VMTGMLFSVRNCCIASDEWLGAKAPSHSPLVVLSKNQQLSTLLFADDQAIMGDTEDKLLKAAHKLNQIITEYGLTVSVEKTKSMAFRGRDQVRTKIIIDNKIMEQVDSFN